MTGEIKSTVFNTELLVDTVQKLSLAKDIQEVMKIVRTVARNLTGADGATFVLRDGDYCFYADEDSISPLWKGNRFPMSQCISGWVMLNKKPVVIPDIYADERIPVDAYRPTFVRSLAMVPIRTIEPIGAIGNYWAKHYQPTLEETKMLQALADITAVSIENIEVRNKLEEKVKERTKELTEALTVEKEIHEMKSAFVSMASHELRTPLSVILSSASLTEKYTHTEQQDQREKHIGRIKSSVKNLVDLLNDFLSIGKLEEGKVLVEYEIFDLKQLIQEIHAELDGMKKTKQEIQLTFKGDKQVKLDKKILRNILFNLLSNAIKYSDENIDLNTEVKNDWVTLVVKDRGIGIPAEQQNNLFGKFFRASNVNSIQGTGLGLNIVKHYIDLLDGTIDFTSLENQGTTFTVSIPNRL